MKLLQTSIYSRPTVHLRSQWRSYNIAIEQRWRQIVFYRGIVGAPVLFFNMHCNKKVGAMSHRLHPPAKHPAGAPGCRKEAARWFVSISSTINTAAYYQFYFCLCGHSVKRINLPPTKFFPWLEMNKTILKPRIAAATGTQYIYVGFSRRNKIPRCSAYDVGESNPVPASGL